MRCLLRVRLLPSLTQFQKALPVLFLLLANTLACSPSVFFGGKEVDEGVKNQTAYRKLNTQCAGLDLSSSAIDPPTFRKILDCFNSNGALEPIAQLSRKLKDSELEPILSHFNRKVLNDDRMLFQLESTFNTLSKRQLLDQSLEQMGKLLAHEEWVASTLTLARIAHAQTRENSLVLRAFERFSSQIDTQWVEQTLDLGLTLASSSSAQQTLALLREENPIQSRDLDREILEPLKSYLVRGGKYGVRDSLLVETLEWLRAPDANLLGALDGVFGARADRIGVQVPRLAHTFKTVLAPTETRGSCGILDDIRILFRAGQHPISCFKGAQVIESPAEFLLGQITGPRRGEVSAFLTGNLPVTASLMIPFCELPPALASSYSSLYRLADSHALEATSELLDAFTAKGLQKYFMRIMGQDDEFRSVYPLLMEITERGLWEDLLFLLTSLTDSQRNELKESIQFLLEPTPELQGRNLYEVIMEILARTPSEDIGRFLRSLAELNRSRELDLERVLGVLRESYYSSDVHPTVDIFKSLLSEIGTTPAGVQIVDTFFKLASEPEFGPSVRLISEMSQNGQLKELLNSLLTLFHKFATRGKMEIHETQAPPFVPQRRHEWSSKKITPISVSRADLALREDDACWKVDLEQSLGDFQKPGYYDRLGHVLSCVNRQGDKQDVQDAILFLADRPLYGKRGAAGSAQNFFELPIEWFKSLSSRIGDAGVRSLSESWAATIRDDRFARLVASFEWFFNRNVNSVEDGQAGTGGGRVAAPLLTLMSGVVEKAEAELLRLMQFASRALRKEEIPQALEFAEYTLRRADLCGADLTSPIELDSEERIRNLNHRLFKRTGVNFGRAATCASTEPERAPWEPQGRHELLTAIGLKECITSTRAAEKRADEIVEDVREARTAWEFFKASGASEKSARMEWSVPELKKVLVPLMKRFLDPEASYHEGTEKRPALQAMLNVFKYFSLPSVGNEVAIPGPREFSPKQGAHYPPEYLARWLQERSTDYQLIPYFYPGESRPRLRYVNSLMKLELVLINADLQYILPDNFGLKFLELIAYAWGDEKYDSWPKLVQQKFGGEKARVCDETGVSEKVRLRRIRDGECPMRLTDAYRVDDAFPTFATTKSILSTLKQFEFLLGYPDLPDCFQWTPEEQARLPRSTGLAGGVLKEEAKISVFNVRQLINIIDDNLPESKSRYAGGAKVLRDLFFEFLVTSPKGTDNAREPERNNLRFVVEMVKLGLGTQASRALRDMPDLAKAASSFGTREEVLSRTALLDFFRAWSSFSNHPASTDLIRSLVQGTEKDPLRTDKALVWPVLESLFDFLEGDREVEGVLSVVDGFSSGRKAANSAFHGLALLEQQGWTGPLVSELQSVFREKTQRAYWANRADLLTVVLGSERIMNAVKLLYGSGVRTGSAGGWVARDHSGRSDLLGVASEFLRERGRVADALEVLKAVQAPRHQGAKSASEKQWDLFRSRASELDEFAAYRKLELSSWSHSILDYFSTASSDPVTAAALRTWMADRLVPIGESERGDIEQFLLLIRDEPEAIGELLATLGAHSGPGGEIDQFLELAKAALKK
jgi:hypothetical protein